MNTTGKIIIAASALAAIALIPYKITVEGKNVEIAALGYRFKKDSEKKITIPGFLAKGDGFNKEEKNNQPLFTQALYMAAAKGKITSNSICKRLAVGKSCAEAFIEMMLEYGVIDSTEKDGVYKVVMPENEIRILAAAI